MYVYLLVGVFLYVHVYLYVCLYRYILANINVYEKSIK